MFVTKNSIKFDKSFKSVYNDVKVNQHFLIDYLERKRVFFMAKAKKTVGAAEAAVIENVVEVSENETKKAPAKKAPAKKTTTKSKEPTITAFIQYAGRELSMSDIVDSIKNVEDTEIKTLDLYIKPEEMAVYYVVNGDALGKKIDF